MCDYSLHSVKSRSAKVGDKLRTRDFGTGTRGFAASEDANVAVCVLPGTELGFAAEVRCLATGLFALARQSRQSQNSDLSANQQGQDGHASRCVGISGWPDRAADICEDQQATVLQLPAEPKTAVEVQSQRRVAYIG
jgi:hypothetical protein